ncbi:hypothetical protein CapIbe_014355 [Capra ibex]
MRKPLQKTKGYPHKSLDSFCYYLNIHGSYIHLRNNYYGQRGAGTLIVQVCVTCAIPGIRHRTLANKWIDIENAGQVLGCGI